MLTVINFVNVYIQALIIVIRQSNLLQTDRPTKPFKSILYDSLFDILAEFLYFSNYDIY